MEDLWKLADTGLAGFIKNLGKEIESELLKQGHNINIGQCSRGKQDQGYSLIWNYEDKYFGDILFSRKPYGGSDLIIDRFWCIDTYQSTRHSPKDFRKVAQIYEDITAFLEKKFGRPISEHDGRAIYQGSIKESELVRK